MRFALVAVTLMALAGVASADYLTDFSTDKSADFTIAQVGQIGMRPSYVDSNTLLDFTGGSLKMGGAWTRTPSLALITSGDANDGKYADTTASLKFSLYGGATFDSTTAGIAFGMSIRQYTALAPADYNTYPLYFVSWDKATSTLSLLEQSGYNRTRILAASSALSLLGGASVYTLSISTNTDAVTGDLSLSTLLLEDGNTVANLSAIDHVKDTVGGQEGGVGLDWADSGVDINPTGYIGFYAGGMNTGVIQRGIQITELKIGAGTPPDPDPVYHAGDSNKDGVVSDADYTIWADNYMANFGSATATWEMGDSNGDKEVTDADYTLWADNYGFGATAVPEPATMSLLGLGLFGLLRRRNN